MKKIKFRFSNIAEDIWFEIFLHLPLASIYKFKCVSKVWFSILSDRSFINQWNILNTLSHPWMLVHSYSYNRQTDHSQRKSFKQTFVYACPEMHSQYITRHQHGFYMEFLNQEQVNIPYLDIVGSSNGLVLCTTSRGFAAKYYVCNPLTKKWVLLPQPRRRTEWVATGFICNDECVASSSHISVYKVIRIADMEASKFEVEIFSSDLGKWNIYDVSYPLDVVWGFSINEKLVTHNGVCYRFQKEQRNLLAFGIRRNNNSGACGNECRSINLPGRAKDEEDWHDVKQYLGESEGLICYAIVNEKKRSLNVWVLEEDWYLMHKDIKFHDTLVEMRSLFHGGAGADNIVSQIQVLGFSPVDKNVVILSYEKYIWGYNTRTRGYEQLNHVPTLGSKISNMSAKFASRPTFAVKPSPTTLPPVTW